MIIEHVSLIYVGKAIGLPDDFLALKKGSKGGGVIQVMSIHLLTSRSPNALRIVFVHFAPFARACTSRQ